ncbi:HU family DNA-binding protein [uncultured Roseibium sp.]|uniref:HU family DNA-binding protein n=1 Tax=uncultured Roseibium sp. TaxID=1936171 RepID=UPI0026237919|nr:HU family DNA-binding protein [uncultured Roseibium sp.]
MSKTKELSHADSIFAEITKAAMNGTETNLTGFGKFKVKETAARQGRNPATGETIQIAASKKLTFAPAKALKDALNG